MSESTPPVRTASPNQLDFDTVGNDALEDEGQDDQSTTASEETRGRADPTSSRSLIVVGRAWKAARRNITTSLQRWSISTVFVKTVTKCVLAYLIATLFTYNPNLSRWMASLLPNNDPDDAVPISNIHFIATVAVYFHPGRSVGSMIEANIFALVGLTYALGLSISSMLVAVYLHENGYPMLSNAITVVLFVGVGVAAIGYAKVQVGRPTFNTACSLMGVIIFVVIVKEGSANLGDYSTDKIWQVTLVVVTGVFISNFVCFLIWPRSACTGLQYDIQRNLRSFSTLLKVLTKTFLLDDIDEIKSRPKRLKSAIDNHHASFVSLKNNLEEAKLEAPFDERIRGRVPSYIRVVDSLNVLAQHLGGLRTSCTLQHDIVDHIRSRDASRAPSMRGKKADVSTDEQDHLPVTSRIGKAKRSAFEHYLDTLGPHVRDLVQACSHSLKGLTTAFEASVSGLDSIDGSKKVVESEEVFQELSKSVRSALRQFKHERTVAIKRSYSMHPSATPSSDAMPSVEGLKSDEDVFVVFYFVFLLEEFAKELEHLVDALEVIRKDEKRIQEQRGRSWWLQCSDYFRQVSPRRDRWGRSFPNHSFGRTVMDLFIKKGNSIQLPSTEAHQPRTRQTPDPMTTRQRLNRFIWTIGEFLKQSETRFAIKAGIGCALLATPAFVPSLRPTFTLFQGQWALITFLVVFSPTVGQSNQMSIHRILGTFAGALTAVGAYWLFPDDNVALPIFGAIFAVPCFYVIIKFPHLAVSGRFVVLTYNLTALYSYNIRKVGIEVEEIAIRRTIDVIVGVLWATVLTHAIWPMEARRELTRGLSDLLFNLGFLYQKLVLAYSSVDIVKRDDKRSRDSGNDEERQLLSNVKENGISAITTIELALQVHLIKLEGLLAQTAHEPRLKGPFPISQYKGLLGNCQHILDLLHTMNLVTSRPDWHTQVRQDFIVPVDACGRRRTLVGNVSLFFWLLASAFRFKTPLPAFMPAAEESRIAVLDTIRQLPVVKRRAIRGSSEYLLYFAYALSMKDLISQLDEIGRAAKALFGVLGGSTNEWEAQFQPSSEELGRLEAIIGQADLSVASSSEAGFNSSNDDSYDVSALRRFEH
jgi:hypothetical protein